MNQEAKVLIGLGVITAVIVVIIGLVATNSSSNLSSKQLTSSQNLIRSDSYSTGPANAKVTLVEFGDFQCPACEAAYPTINKITSQYQGKLNFVFRNFPLPQHTNAPMAAEAAEAAGNQGKFFEMYDKLYTYQSDWVNLSNPLDKFVGYAQDLRLDINKFKQEVSQNKYANKISQDQNDGNSLGVDSTPTFFLNGEKIVGVPNYNNLKSKVDALLR